MTVQLPLSGVVPASVFLQATGMDFRVNATSLPHEVQESFDDAMVKVATEELKIVEDFRQAGMIQNENLGTTLSKYQTVSRLADAERAMNISTEARADSLQFGQAFAPIPIVYCRFPLDFRQEAASNASKYENIDTIGIEEATRNVALSIEDMVYNGDDHIVLGNNTCDGITNASKTHTFTFEAGAGKGWSDANANPLNDVNKATTLLRGDGHSGPYDVYVSSDGWEALGLDYQSATGSHVTMKQRIEMLPEIRSVRLGTRLPANHVLVIKMIKAVADIAIGQDITNNSWQPTPFATEHVVWAAMGPRVKSDFAAQKGIVVIK